MSEKELKENYLKRLERDFFIDEEVTGTHFSGESKRIDAVLKPKSPHNWKNPQVAIGIEFKDTPRFSKTYDTNNYTKWLAQCFDYTLCSWD